MIKLKKGMYIRCPVDGYGKDARQFLLGKIIEIDDLFDIVKVEYFDLYKTGVFFKEFLNKRSFFIDDIERCRIMNKSDVIVNTKNNRCKKGTIISAINTKNDDFYQYYIKLNDDRIIKVDEKDIKVHFNRDYISPVNQLIRYEFHNPIWHKCRHYASDYSLKIENAPNGIECMIGSRVYLMPHQIDTVLSIVNERECRFMLADEVGLGKTIEACIILKYLKSKNKGTKALIIVPDSLIYQWKTELEYKFWLNVDIENESPEGDVLLYPIEKILNNEFNYIFRENWDLLIVDETHRIVNMEYEYKTILNLSKKIKNVILITATPIQQRKSEYLKFLKVLKPEYYEGMSEDIFSELLEKQSNIRSILYRLVRDLEFYESDELEEYYKEDLEEISEEIEDKVFDSILEEINILDNDRGLKGVKLALSYLGEYYQIERQIIRHRRIELKDQLSERKLDEIKYIPAGSMERFYENDVIENIEEYLSSIVNSNEMNSTLIMFVKEFISALHSSPWALEFMLKERKESIKNNNILERKIDDEEKIISPRKENERRRRIVSSVGTISDEIEILNDLIDLNNKWIKANLEELKNIDYLYNYPELIKTKFLRILDYVSENYDGNKAVIFTSWVQTAEKIEEFLKMKFGPDSYTSFYSGKSDLQLQENADKFQNDQNCKFIVCDELGGEGRNFQAADILIHFDIPWSPIVLEQRIGRLDRIGRGNDRDVISIVAYAEDTIEEDLFKIWRDALKVFNESLSGLELVFEEIEDKITKSLESDIKYGLNEAFDDICEYSEQMKEFVEEEQYIDMARHLDKDREDEINDILNNFSAEKGKKLKDMMNKWGNLVGFRPIEYSEDIYLFRPESFSVNSFKNTFFTLPDMEKNRAKTRNNGFIKGTFSRDIAIEKEDLEFFAPGNEFFESIINNAIEVNRGKCCALRQYSRFNWKGIILKWRIDININRILEKDINAFDYIKKEYMPNAYIYTLYKIEGDNVEDEDILDEYMKTINDLSRSKSSHLGKRSKNITGKSNLDIFKEEYPIYIWKNIVGDAYNSGKEEIKNKIKKFNIKSKINEDSEKYINAIESVNRYYKYNNNQSRDYINKEQEYYKIIMNNMSSCKLITDSAVMISFEVK